MDVHESTESRRGRSAARELVVRLVKPLVAFIVVASVVVLVPAAADAVGVSGRAGRPGAVRVMGPQIVGYETLTNFGGHRVMGTGGAVVRRSPATRSRQRITARYQLEQGSNGRWSVLAVSPTYRGYVQGAQRAIRMPAWSVAPSRDATMQRGYRITYVIRWYNARNRMIAREWVFPNRVGEARCATSQRSCWEYSDGIFY